MQPIINTMLDPIVNFGKVTVSTGYSNIETTVVLNSGEGSKLPDPSSDGSFNLVWFNSSSYGSASDDPNVEIVRCIARVGDTLSLMRGQEGTYASNKNAVGKTYKMILSLTKKTVSDIKAEYVSGVSTHASITTSVHGFDPSGNAPPQVHGSSKHTGVIGTEASITFATTGGHAHTGSDSTKVDHTNLLNIGTNAHSQIDTAITASAGHIAANGTSVHGLGTISTQAANNVTITGGSISGITDLAVADGGTGASNASTALSNLGGRPLIPRTTTITSSATPIPNADTTDNYMITALGAAATFGSPTGTPNDGQRLMIRIKDNATARALSWNAIYRSGTDVSLPTTTVISKTMYLGFIYNSSDSKWDLVASMGNI